MKFYAKWDVRLICLFLLLSGWAVFTLGVLQVGSILWGDSLSYFALTRSLAIERNLDLSFEATHPNFGFPHPPKISAATGRVVLPYSPGVSIFWLIGFVDGQLASWLLNLFGTNFSLDGYSWITQLVLGYWAVGFSVLGFWLMILAWQHFSKRKQTAVELALVVLFSTNLFFYTFLDPLNSHSLELMFSAAAAFLTAKILKQNSLEQIDVFYLGSAAAALGFVRNQDWLLLIPLSIAIYVLSKSKQRLKNILILILPALFLLSLQLVITHYYFASWGSPYTLSGYSLDLFRADFLRIWFSSSNGLIYFSPILLFSLYGLWQQTKSSQASKRQFSLIALTFFFLQSWIIASWMREIIGGPYGSRMFIGTLPWISFGLFWWLESLPKMVSTQKRTTQLLILLFIIWNFAQTAYMLWKW